MQSIGFAFYNAEIIYLAESPSKRARNICTQQNINYILIVDSLINVFTFVPCQFVYTAASL